MGSKRVMGNFGPPVPEDPLAIGAETEVQQADIAAMIDRVQGLVSTRYDMLPIFVQSGLLSVLQQSYSDDPDYTWDNDPDRSRIVITRDWRRDEQNRDTRPILSVSFKQSVGKPYAMGDAMARTGLDTALVEKRSVMDISTFEIVAYHSNSVITTLLAGRARSLINVNRRKLQSYFKLQDVNLATLGGASASKEYDDLFEAHVQVQVMSLPVWTEHDEPQVIRKLLLLVQANAAHLLQQMELPTHG